MPKRAEKINITKLNYFFVVLSLTECGGKGTSRSHNSDDYALPCCGCSSSMVLSCSSNQVSQSHLEDCGGERRRVSRGTTRSGASTK